MKSWDIYGYTALVASLIVMVMGVWQGIKTWQLKTMNRVEIARDETYRKLAEESIATQQKMAENQQKMTEELSELRASITSIEKMLHEID